MPQLAAGGQPCYWDLAIETGLMLPLAFYLLLRQTEGLAVSVFELMGVSRGVRARRTWRKLHPAVDANTGMVMASTLTGNDMGDSSQVTPLLNQIDAEIGSVTFDGAYDGAPAYDAVAARAGDIPVIIPPHATAAQGGAADRPSQRDRHITLMASRGRLGWQKPAKRLRVFRKSCFRSVFWGDSPHCRFRNNRSQDLFARPFEYDIDIFYGKRKTLSL